MNIIIKILSDIIFVPFLPYSYINRQHIKLEKVPVFDSVQVKEGAVLQIY